MNKEEVLKIFEDLNTSETCLALSIDCQCVECPLGNNTGGCMLEEIIDEIRVCK